MRRGSARRVTTAVSAGAAALVLVVVTSAAPALAAARGPTATAEATNVAVGDFVRVTGANWGEPGSGVVQVVVCGNDAINNSADCDLADTAEGAIRAGGTFFAGITIHAPPRPCPCLLRVFSTGTYVDVKIPIRIAGVPNATPVAAPGSQRRISLSRVGISGSGPLLSWVGAAPKRSVHFDVTNAGDVTLTNPPIDVAWGSGSNPTGFIEPPQVGVLAPGQTKSVTVAIPMHAISLGAYTVVVKASPVGGLSATAHADTTIIPWGWIVLALILLQLILLKARNRARQRQGLAEQEASPVTDRPGAELVGVAAGTGVAVAAAVPVAAAPPPPPPALVPAAAHPPQPPPVVVPEPPEEIVLAPDRPDWAAVEADLAEAVGPGLAALVGHGNAPTSDQLRVLAGSLAGTAGRPHGLDDAAIEALASSLHEEFVGALQPATVGADRG